MRQKGLTPIVILIVLVLLVVSGILIFGKDKLNNNPGQICTQDAMQCSDGSYVGRTGENCSFAVCP